MLEQRDASAEKVGLCKLGWLQGAGTESGYTGTAKGEQCYYQYMEERKEWKGSGFPSAAIANSQTILHWPRQLSAASTPSNVRLNRTTLGL